MILRYIRAASNIELMMNLNIDLSTVSEWLRANKLTVNVNKTKYVVFGSRHMLQDKPDLNLKISGQKIERVSVMKYLGVLLDDTLTFEDHIQYVVDKATKKLGILRKSREFLPRNTSILLYKSLVLPHIDYCDLVYMTASEYHLNRLQLIQNVASRIILRANRRTSIKFMHNELKLLMIKDRQQIHLSMECFRQINTISGLNDLFVKHDTGRVTRGTNMNNMKIPVMNTATGRKAFSYRGPSHWNTLPPDLKINDNKNSFKSGVSKLFARDVNHPG